VPLLLEAAAELKRRGHSFKLTLVGDGELRPDVEAIIGSLNLDGCVILAGMAASDAVIGHLQNSRAMVLPSFAEGLPVVIMESLAVGTPVIVSAIAGTPELVDAQCGWLVPAGSVDSLVEAMESALEASGEQLSSMGAIGRARIVESHNAAINARQLAMMFREGQRK
jgi:glycosyltransferase involved in cell wall biosynthesis